MVRLDAIDVVLGLLIAIPVLWTCWSLVFGRQRSAQRQYRALLQDPSGLRHGVLIVNLLPDKDVAGALQTHRTSEPTLLQIPDSSVLSLHRAQVPRSDQDHDYAIEVRRLIAELIAKCVGTIHLYFAGPRMSPALHDAILATGVRVFVYHYRRGSHQRSPHFAVAALFERPTNRDQ